VNVQGTAKLFAKARSVGVSRLVLISTMSAYPGCISLYGRAKMEMERIAADYGALILRPGLVYGERAGGMYGSLEAQVQKSRVIPLIGGGDQVLYLVHEEDLSHAAVSFCSDTKPAPAQAVMAAHDQPWTFRQILEEIARRANLRRSYLPIPWRLVWFVLKTAEKLGLKLGFRSDSLISLVNQNPHPDFAAGHPIDFHPRPFSTAVLLMEE
jgi:nucleoside-diphosphate-sugar epimerase